MQSPRHRGNLHPLLVLASSFVVRYLSAMNVTASHALWMPTKRSSSDPPPTRKSAFSGSLPSKSRRDDHCAIGDERQNGMPEPILEHGLISGLHARTLRHHDRVHDSRYAEGSDRECGAHERSPRGAHYRRKRAAPRRSARRSACRRLHFAAAGFRAGIRDECDHDELESRQRGGRRADDDVEILPIGKRRLGGNGNHAMGGSGGGPARINWRRQLPSELLRRGLVTSGLPF